MTRFHPLALALLMPVAASAQSAPVDRGPANAGFAPAFAAQTRAPALGATPVEVSAFAAGLEHPWGIAALPDGRFLVTERPGRLRVIAADGSLSAPVAGLPPVDAQGQGGLLDVAIGPDFARDRMIYWTYAKATGGGTATAAARGVLSQDGAALRDVEDIFVQEPPSPTPMHYGARILFDGDGHVFITTGEHSRARERVLAQDPATTYGKVIRLNADGSVPADNPFSQGGGLPSIWSLGHRNIQGAAIHPGTGVLWINEHGPAGGDELNRVQAGLNYGWPEVSYGLDYDGSPIGTGEPRMQGMEEPVYYWDPVIAPAGMAFYEGDLFDWQGDLLIAGLNPGELVRLEMQDGRVTGEESVIDDVGRVRDLMVDADGSLLLLIDAADGAVLRVTPSRAGG